MATQTHVTLIDDIDGSSAVETVAFGLDGADYEIDLNEKNAKKLRDVLASTPPMPGRSAAVATGRGRAARRSRPAPGSSKEQLAAIREWARGQGYEVSDRGRLSAAVVQAFEDAH